MVKPIEQSVARKPKASRRKKRRIWEDEWDNEDEEEDSEEEQAERERIKRRRQRTSDDEDDDSEDREDSEEEASADGDGEPAQTQVRAQAERPARAQTGTQGVTGAAAEGERTTDEDEVDTAERSGASKHGRGDRADRLDFRFGNPSGERRMIELARTVIDQGEAPFLHGESGESPRRPTP